MQMLVLVILAVFLGIFSLVRAKANKLKEHDQDYPQDARTQESQRRRHWQIQPLHRRSVHRELSSSATTAGPNVSKHKKFVGKILKELKYKRPRFFSKAAQQKAIIEQPVLDFDAPGKAGQVKTKKELARERKKDLRSGMELLELSFLLSIVENTKGNDEKDVIIRKLNFKELLRRGKLNEADSNALKVYAINEGNLYGKDIQCEAMKNLAERTANGSKPR